MQTQTMNICGLPCNILGFIKDKRSKKLTPLVDISMMSDYKWQQRALQSRIEHPEYYEKTENV